MSVVALASVKGSPGVTTATLALATVWPRPVVVVECDRAGGDITAGFLAGMSPPDGGLLGLALALRRGQVSAADVRRWCLPLDGTGERWVLAAPNDPDQCAPILAATGQLIRLLSELSSVVEPCDVLLDCGRLSANPHDDEPFLSADVSLLVLRPTLRAAQAVQFRLRALQGVGHLGLLLVSDQPYPARDIEAALDVPVVGTLGNDVLSAAILAGERAATRGLERGLLLRSARTVTDTLATAGGDLQIADMQVDAAVADAPSRSPEPALPGGRE